MDAYFNCAFGYGFIIPLEDDFITTNKSSFKDKIEYFEKLIEEINDNYKTNIKLYYDGYTPHDIFICTGGFDNNSTTYVGSDENKITFEIDNKNDVVMNIIAQHILNHDIYKLSWIAYNYRS